MARGHHPSRLAPVAKRRRWMLVAAVVVAVGLLTALFAFGLSRDPTEIRSVLVGRPAPDFALSTLDRSRTVHMADLRGQVVVINFWASWCAPCRREHPALQAAWERYRDQGVVIIGIPFQDKPSDATAYMTELGGDWPQLLDPAERTALAYGVYGVPETYVVGPDGRVAFKRVGVVTYPMLTDQIGRLLPGSS